MCKQYDLPQSLQGPVLLQEMNDGVNNGIRQMAIEEAGNRPSYSQLDMYHSSGKSFSNQQMKHHLEIIYMSQLN